MIAELFSTLIDFKPYPSLILFTTGCNLRCPYCYNSSLVKDEVSKISLDEADYIIDQYRRFVQGLVISGGEPLLHQNDEFISFIERQKRKGLKIKLDSNLTLPVDKFKDLLFGISFTIKPLSYYVSNDNIKTIQRNLELLRDLPWKEVRITVVNDETLFDSLQLFKRQLDGWTVNIHRAIPTESVLDPDNAHFFVDDNEYRSFASQIADSFGVAYVT